MDSSGAAECPITKTGLSCRCSFLKGFMVKASTRPCCARYKHVSMRGMRVSTLAKAAYAQAEHEAGSRLLPVAPGCRRIRAQMDRAVYVRRASLTSRLAQFRTFGTGEWHSRKSRLSRLHAAMRTCFHAHVRVTAGPPRRPGSHPCCALCLSGWHIRIHVVSKLLSTRYDCQQQLSGETFLRMIVGCHIACVTPL